MKGPFTLQCYPKNSGNEAHRPEYYNIKDISYTNLMHDDCLD